MGPLELVIAEAAQHRRDSIETFSGACGESKVERMCAVEDCAHLSQGSTRPGSCAVRQLCACDLDLS